jgi:cytochrome d ubiquinol oxidase subunit II
MTLPEVVLALMWVGVTAYALFGGADFGAGVWDLVAGGARAGTARRRLIEHSLGPVWEANHVWLIFVLVVLWTAFPAAFAAIASTLYLPLTLAAVGIIARGSAFAFRKAVEPWGLRRTFGVVFAFSSVVTPFFLGAAVGGVASGRIPPGIAQGDVWRSWLNPTSMLGGVLAVLVSAYLAAVFLCSDAERDGEFALAAWFRTRAMVTAVLVGAVALAGIAVLRADAPRLFAGLTGRALPLVIVSGLAGLASAVLLLRRRFTLARPVAGLAVAAVVWGWAAGQYPFLLQPDLTIAAAAAPRATLQAMVVCLIVGGLLLTPSLILLYALFQRSVARPASAPSGQRPPRHREREHRWT